MNRLTTSEEYPHGAEGVAMDRLTGNWCRGNFEATACVEKLSRYEDTGLEPGEIKKAVVLAKAGITEALKENERSIAILKNMGADTRQIEAASTGLKNLLIKFEG